MTTVNLQRVNAAMDRLRAVLREHPEVRQRTAEFLAGDPDPEELDALAEEGDNGDTENDDGEQHTSAGIRA